MKVYVVTSGCYSEYQIEAVFTDYTKARIYANLDSSRTIEEYEADQVGIDSVNDSELRFSVWYEIEKDRITDIHQINYDFDAEIQEIYTWPRLRFCVKASARLLESIKTHGKYSPLLKKIAQDTLAQFLYRKGTSREEYIRQYREKHEEPCQPYVPATTSSSFNYPLGLMSFLWEQYENRNKKEVT